MIEFRLNGSLDGIITEEVEALLGLVCISEGVRTGRVVYNLVSPSEIKDVNVRFLDHDYVTDIITFCYNDDPDGFSMEAFVCIEEVLRLADEYGRSAETEVLRVFVHGLLHCLGYDDQSEWEVIEMRKREDMHLEEFVKVSRGT